MNESVASNIGQLLRQEFDDAAKEREYLHKFYNNTLHFLICFILSIAINQIAFAFM